MTKHVGWFGLSRHLSTVLTSRLLRTSVVALAVTLLMIQGGGCGVPTGSGTSLARGELKPARALPGAPRTISPQLATESYALGHAMLADGCADRITYDRYR